MLLILCELSDSVQAAHMHKLVYHGHIHVFLQAQIFATDNLNDTRADPNFGSCSKASFCHCSNMMSV